MSIGQIMVGASASIHVLLQSVILQADKETDLGERQLDLRRGMTNLLPWTNSAMTPLRCSRTKYSSSKAPGKFCVAILLFLALQLRLSSAVVPFLDSIKPSKTRKSPLKTFGWREHLDVQSESTRQEDVLLHPPSNALRKLRAGASLVPKSITPTAQSIKGFSYYARVALAGGLAGATGTTVLYPLDSAKTLRQSSPSKFGSVQQALWHLIRSPSSTTIAMTSWRLPQAYRGLLPAALGAIPSSALYFGTYETSKRYLEQRFSKEDGSVPEHRWWIHGLAAASGNTISSAVFVPKEVLKQQLQYHASSGSFHEVLLTIVREKGIRGLYAGYSATLMRNIPSTMVRFVLYEELKQRWLSQRRQVASGTADAGLSRPTTWVPTPVGLFAAGAVAGAVASGLMTPVDVIKTRLATGTCPVGIQNCFRHVVKETGWRGLYAGAGSRMMWSAAFSAIGFGTFEVVKDALGVSDNSKVKGAAQ